MKRKLVNYEVFTKMQENSFSTAVSELAEAEDYLARTLEIDELKLNSFNESSAIYEATDGTYVKTNFSIDKDKINFDDVEVLVLDEASEKKEVREVVKNLLEAVLGDNKVEADKLFVKYMELASQKYKRFGALTEGRDSTRLYGTRMKNGKPKIFHRKGAKNPKKVAAALRGHRSHSGSYIRGANKRKRNISQERARRVKLRSQHSTARVLSGGSQYTGKRKRFMNECLNLVNNVFGWVDMQENGHVLAETRIVENNDGTLQVSLPTAKARNEAKIIKMTYDHMLKTDMKILRESASRLVHNDKFCQAISEIKRHNNMSDNDGLEESIGKLVANCPSVLYLTEEELARTISLALDRVGALNYDDQTCRFMAEGILRVAHNSYQDRVGRILKLANKDMIESDDRYSDFQRIVKEFFPTIDESIQLEMKVFEDLYNTIGEVQKLAIESRNELVQKECNDFIGELDSVLNGQELPSLDLATDIANWLEDLAEANLPGASNDWEVNKSVHISDNGDHPKMAKLAKVDGTPGAHGDDYGDPAPMISGDKKKPNKEASEEARKRSWGNKGGDKVWPSLSNPVAPTPGEFTMKGQKGADKESGLGEEDGDTWPGLKNPYLPASMVPRQKVQPDNAVEP